MNIFGHDKVIYFISHCLDRWVSGHGRRSNGVNHVDEKDERVTCENNPSGVQDNDPSVMIMQYVLGSEIRGIWSWRQDNDPSVTNMQCAFCYETRGIWSSTDGHNVT
jgi:hypothetical protein